MPHQRQLDFDYDLWANTRWLHVAPRMEHGERAMDILHHIAAAQWIWLTRIQDSLGDKESRMPEPVALNEGVFKGLHDAWLRINKGWPDQEEIRYSNSKGEKHSNTLDEITTHVLNHGTYHRGQLRGLAEAEDFSDFEDTDFIRFTRG